MARRVNPLTDRQLQALARTVERRILRQLVAALTKIRAGVKLTELERALVARNFEAARKALGLDQVVAALKEAQRATNVVRDQAWYSVIAKLPKEAARELVRLTVGRYARQSPRVMEAIRSQNLTRIQGIRRETVTAMRQTFTKALAQGTPPRETARLLRSMLGLNTRQAGAVRRLRQEMQAKGIEQSVIDKRIERESARRVRQRSVVVVRTESMEALSGGKRLQQERLVKEKIISVEQWEQEIVTADDERTCPICTPLNGVRFPVLGTIATSAGIFTGPPFHVGGCRCVSRLVLKGFRAGQIPSPVRRAILRAAA